MLSIPPNMQAQHCDSTPAPSTKKTTETRVFDGNCFDATNTGQKQHSDKTKTGSLTDDVKVIREALNQPQLEIYDTDTLTGALCLSTHIIPADPASITQICTMTAQQYPQFTYRMLFDQSKLVLLELGVLVKINAKKYRWANQEELEALKSHHQKPLKATTKSHQKPPKATTTNHRLNASAQQFKKLCYACSPQRLIEYRQRKAAESNYYLDALPDGTFTEVRKPFTPPYTPAEKKQLRERDAAAEQAKIAEEIRQLKQKADTRDQQKLEREVTLQKQELWAASELERTELQIKQAYDAQKWATFQKPAIVLGVLAVLGIAVWQLNETPATKTETLKATTMPGMTTYTPPNWVTN